MRFLFISYALSAQDDRGGVSVPFAKDASVSFGNGQSGRLSLRVYDIFKDFDRRNISRPCHSERSVSEVELFPPRSRMSLHSIRSSLCSDFDYAQDDTVEKASSLRDGISDGRLPRTIFYP